MLSFFFETPAGYHRGPLVLVMILEAENVERMKQSDPFDLHLRDLHPPPEYRASDIDLVIAYEEDHDRLAQFQKDRDIVAFMTWLERGHQIRPGDVGPPRPVDFAKRDRKQ